MYFQIFSDKFLLKFNFVLLITNPSSEGKRDGPTVPVPDFSGPKLKFLSLSRICPGQKFQFLSLSRVQNFKICPCPAFIPERDSVPYRDNRKFRVNFFV